mgnify:CR=1 FL=1
MLVPSILILNSFVNYLFNLQINSFITSLSFLSILDQILSRFDNSTHVLILILLLYLLLFITIALPSVGEPNSVLNFWMKKNKVVYGIYELSFIVIVVSVLIKWVLSIELDPTDVSFMTNFFLILIGLMLHTYGSLTISLNHKMLINANKIILDLNNKIIFYQQ